MFEIFWKDLIFKELLILDNKTIATISPLDYVTILLLLQYSICLYDEIRNLLFTMNPLLICSLLGLLLPIVGLVLRGFLLTLVFLETDAVL